jgi:hypothetical protein
MNLKTRLKEIIQIPNKPKALPSNFFPNKTGEYSWEDWNRDAKTAYPIRFLLSETIPLFVATNITRPWNKASDYLKYHLLPSKIYHKLDLRLPDDIPDYKYGWLDSNTKMFHALMRILIDFIEKEHGGLGKYYDWVEYQNDCCDGKNPQHQQYLEIGSIYEWFKVGRVSEQAEIDVAMSTWIHARQTHGKSMEVSNAINELNKLEKQSKEKETRMLCRLIELRELMWT